MHDRGSYDPVELATVPEYTRIITETNAILQSGISDNEITPSMLKRLQEDVFLFSGLKTHTQLFEASRQLLNEDGTIKPKDKFIRDVQDVKKSHRKYLDAEYDFAVGSVLMAEKWESLNDSDRYYLQYRTAADDRVRESHQVLHTTTLPKDDPFWDVFFPPNGWRCRCTVVQVLKKLNEPSDSAKAYRAGEVATTRIGKNGKNKLAIFRFNPGKQKVVFPPDHPYGKVKDASKVKDVSQKLYKTQSIAKEPLDEENVLSIFGVNKGEVAKDNRVKEARKIHKRMTQVEAFSVIRYTGNFYYNINSYLRTGKRNQETMESYVRVTNSGLDRIKSYKGYSYRGTKLKAKEFEKYLNAKNSDSLFVEPAYLSTTSDTSKVFKGNAFFEVKSKSGKSVKDVSQFPDELEILFKAGTRFKVIEAVEVDGKYNIILEEA